MLLNKRTIAIIIAILMNLFCWVPLDYGVDTAPQKAEDDVRIVSFNVRCASDLEGTVAVRSKLLIALLKNYQPDSFGVQEAKQNWLWILGFYLDDYAYVGEMRDDTSGSEASAVFYLKDKYNLLDSGTIWLSDTPEVKGSKHAESSLPRIATWATLENKETGEVYTHINTHLDHVGRIARVKQIEVLKAKITELEQKTGNPVVCTGDFNVAQDTTEYKTMTSLLSDSKFLAKESDEGLTYHAYGTKESGKPIDFIFVPADSEVSRYRIMDEMVWNMFVSDHYGLCVDLKF